jgi:hypothetical protein
LIISYSRPFKGSYNFKGQASSLQDFTGEVLNQDEVELHNRVIAMRDTAYAHSDASAHLLEGFDYDKYSGFMISVQPLDKSATDKLKIMIQKWANYLEAKKAKLKELRTHQT